MQKMSFEEKLKLKNNLLALPREGLKEVINMVGAVKNSSGGFELDLENLSTTKLREIERFIGELNAKYHITENKILSNNVNFINLYNS